MILIISLLCLLGLNSIVGGQDWREIVIYPSKVEPEAVEVLEGASVTGHCGSLSPVKWTYSRSDLFDQEDYTSSNYDFPILVDHHLINNSIVIYNLNTLNSGSFNCIGTYKNENGKIEQFRNWFYVKVFSEVPMGFVLPSLIEVSENENVTIVCGSIKKAEWFGVTLANQQDKIVNFNRLTFIDSDVVLLKRISQLAPNPGQLLGDVINF